MNYNITPIIGKYYWVDKELCIVKYQRKGIYLGINIWGDPWEIYGINDDSYNNKVFSIEVLLVDMFENGYCDKIKRSENINFLRDAVLSLLT